MGWLCRLGLVRGRSRRINHRGRKEAQRTQRKRLGDWWLCRLGLVRGNGKKNNYKRTQISFFVELYTRREGIFMEIDKLTGKVIGCAIEVHSTLGPGLLETVYESCLAYELVSVGIEFRTQVPIVIRYKESVLDITYRADFIIEDSLLLELKAVESLNSLHESQILTYLKLSGIKTGLLLNFNTCLLRSGIRRFRN